MKGISFFLLFLITLKCYTQESIGNSIKGSERLLTLYQSGLLEQVVKEEKESSSELLDSYLVEISKLRLGIASEGNLDQLIADNAGYPFNTIASYWGGNAAFQNGDLPKAEKYFRAIDASQLEESERADYYFKRGYLFLEKKDYKKANAAFTRSSKIKRDDKLAYYLGFTHYHLGNIEDALTFLEQVESDSFVSSANYFISSILLEDGKYEEVIQRSQTELTEERSETNSGFYQLIGEAYSKTGDTFRAYQYFSKAITLHPSEPSSTLWYQAGIASFKNSKNQEAIERLERAGLQGGDYASLSAFQLGRVFLAEKQYEKSLLAYKEAMASSDAKINEEALFYVAKLNIEKRNFSEGIDYLEDYSRQYPNGSYRSEANELLAESYLRTSDYDQAIDHLTALGIASESQKEVYQKVTFQKAQLAFNDAKFQEAIRWSGESNRFPRDTELVFEAQLLLGESYFQLEDFSRALIPFRQAGNHPKALYGTGYSLFNLKKYQEAIPVFQKLIASSANSIFKTDAKLRLADCRYATKSYESARKSYQELNSINSTAYQFFQLGVVSKELGDIADAINYFEKSIDTDRKVFGDDAAFKIGEIKFEQANFKEAELYFSEIIDLFPASRYIDQALLNRAICLTNLGELENASRDYRLILLDHMRSESSFDALLGLQSIASQGVEIRNLEEYIEGYKRANPESKTVELVEFEYAKGLYFDLKYEEAIGAMSSFLLEYPESVDSTEVRYYLADSYYRTRSLENAREEFERLSLYTNNWTGRVLSRLGGIYAQLEYYADAIDNYQQLVDLRLTPKYTYTGRVGLLESFYAGENYPNTIAVADSIIKSSWQPLNATRNAWLFKARSFLALARYSECLDAIKQIENKADEISAEADFMAAKVTFLEGEYATSIEQLFEFNSTYGSYRYWIDESYLLIADNYIQMGELFQAKATLNSIIEHSESTRAKQQANEKLMVVELKVKADTLELKGGEQ